MADESSRPKDDGLDGDDAAAIERRLEAFEERLRAIGDPSLLSAAELDEAEDLLRKLGYADTGANANETAASMLQARIDQLEEKAGEIGVRPDTAAIDAEFEAKLKSLEERAKNVHETRQAQKAQVQKTMKSDREAARGLGLGLSIAYTILGLPMAGYFIGWLIDRQTGNTTASGLLTVLGAFLGVFMAIYMVNRSQPK